MSEFQSAVLAWMLECFGADSIFDKQERSIRFLEECLELAQACGVTIDQAYAMVDFVFKRNAGEIDQEVGGVMVTLAALCAALSIICLAQRTPKWLALRLAYRRYGLSS